jgi:hypothetical protein
LQHVIVPVTRNAKTFRYQDGVSRSVTLGFGMLTTIDFDDEVLFEAHEVENEVLKWHLPPKLEEREPSAAEQSPHGRFSVGGLATHLLCEMADALGGRPMMGCLRHEPLTRRLTA